MSKTKLELYCEMFIYRAGLKTLLSSVAIYVCSLYSAIA